MSETQDAAGDPQPAPFDFSGIPDTTRDLQATYDWYGLPDTQLQRMAQWANQTGEGIGVTLVLPGGTMSGTIVSASVYYQGVSKQFLDLLDTDDEKQVKAAKEYADFFFDQPAKYHADQVKKDDQAFKDGELTEPRHMMTRHIHLKDSRYSVPGGSNLELGYTRILLSQVAGFAVGQRWWQGNP